jgi:hypothetical protein
VKIVLGGNYASYIYVDTKNELGLGPFDFAMVGDDSVAGFVGGRFSLVQHPKKCSCGKFEPHLPSECFRLSRRKRSRK